MSNFSTGCSFYFYASIDTYPDIFLYYCTTYQILWSDESTYYCYYHTIMQFCFWPGKNNPPGYKYRYSANTPGIGLVQHTRTIYYCRTVW